MPEISFWQFLVDLTNPQLGFLPRALIVAVIASVVCAVVGCYVVLRGMAFIGDAVAHAVFPGLAVAFALQVSVLLGGAVAGMVVAVLIAVFSQRERVKEDTVIGIFFAAAFALGLVVISRVEGYTASLTSFLFGSLTGVSTSDMWVSLGAGTVVVALILGLQPWLTAVSLDRETARSMNLPVLALDLLLYLAVTTAVVISVRTIGNILVVALLVTPAAIARMYTDKLGVMMALAAGAGVTGSVLGVWLSWAYDTPTGATVVLCLTAIFVLSWLFSPQQGLVTERIRNRASKERMTVDAGSR
ncbi:anchored repeat-type ABC transporter permease subunit [Corynebacterium urinipleomorphum]|uniref:anchored repeat-type ABC transporter permease subunit n=1 Tax=Corynebacterium urinipleomorphum TaxID=1852380 RepID=UPI00194E6723|nr:anchored repeat-type ABC transporter permease subunit [Corynebacterium urinipleomorphum]